MSRLREQKYDPQVKNALKKKQKTPSLVDYVAHAKGKETLIGMQYVVEMKMLESHVSVVKCNLCNVEGQMTTMREHLLGTNHIRLYMEKHYFKELESIMKSSRNKPQFVMQLKDYAKVIERTERSPSIKVDYVSAADMMKEQENRMAKQDEKLESRVDQNKFKVLDKRQMALNYSEKFKIASREEATLVLNLTQKLSDQLEQYFWKYKGLDILGSTTPNSISTKSTPAPTNFHPIVHENLHPKSDASQGLKKEMQRHTEDLASSVGTPSVHSFDRLPLEDTRALKRKPEVSEDASHHCDVLPGSSSASEFQSRKKRLHKEDFSTLHQSSFPYMNIIGSAQPSSVEVSSSHASSLVTTYPYVSIPKEKSCVPDRLREEMHMVKDTSSQSSISQNSLYANISKNETVQEVKSLNGTDTADKSEVSDGTNTGIPGPSSSTSKCSSDPSSERPSSSQAQGKTSKPLSPDLLELLKGKDANTVTNILRTLSPFYPALQEVNIEILAQVLVNTGALD